MFKPVTLIPPVTAAVTVVAPFQAGQRRLPCTISATGLAGAEVIPILFSVDGGVTFSPLSQDGANVELSVLSNSKAITSPFLLGVTKPVTVGAVGVTVMFKQEVDK